MKTNKLPSKEYLEECLDYNPETGVFTWKERPIRHFKNKKGFNIWNSQNKGKTAGCEVKTKHSKKYVVISIKKTRYYAHRIAAVILGYELRELDEIDHKDGDGTNNRKSNLRVVSKAENALNKARQRNNKSGVVGVCFLNREQKWRARINKGGKEITIGLFSDFESAALARKQAEVELGFHENHGGRDAESKK